jgi:FMN phosphatase YigB (HAD superfamily)
MSLRFFYFDMGNVLLLFDHEIACRQVAELTGLTAQRVRQIIFKQDLENRYEGGEITSREFYDIFCEESGARPNYDALHLACSKIFELNAPIVPIVAQMRLAGHRLGILSNTCEAHWQYVIDGRYRLLRDFFDIYALSFEIKSMKPGRPIYEAAAKMAGVTPQEVFFVDDRVDNVEGACAAGFDAVRFVSAGLLAKDLRKRGVEINY